MRRPIACGLAAASLLLAAAAPASADSIAYVKDGNVWLASPDGARQQQVTRTGGYAYVSQADDGTMIALAPKERLHRLSRTGQVLADFTTMVSDGAPTSGPINRFHGPFEPQISPDGKKVAFEWFNDSYGNGSGCQPSSVPPCYVYTQSQGVAITHADRLTGPEEFGLMTGWIYPHWVSNDLLLRSSSGKVLNDDAVFTGVGPGQGDDVGFDPWMFDQIGSDVVDVEITRDLKAVVGIAGSSDELLRVYRPTTHPFGAPNWNHSPFAQGNVPVVEPCFQGSGPVGGKFETPSFSPDGRRLAYGVGDGIWVMDIPDFSAGCSIPDSPGKLVIPGGRHADWGPADIPPPGAYDPVIVVEPPVPPGRGGDDGGGGRPDPDGGDKPVTLRVAKTTLSKALAKGLTLTVRTGRSGRATAKVRRGRTVLGQGAVAVGASGEARLRVRLSGKGAGALRRLGKVALRVEVAFTPAGGARAPATTATVTLRR